MEYAEIIKELKSMSNPKNVEGMARFGINPKNTYGISIPNLERIAKKAGKDHALAAKLWNSEVHEARILASIVDEPGMVTEKQMEKWVKDFDSWDICDQCCSRLFSKTEFAFKKARQWCRRDGEFVKRAGFAMITALTVHDKTAADKKFLQFLPIIERESGDERNFVKKAVNWALRQIGKRNKNLNKSAIEAAKRIQKMDSKSAKWIASDALRELGSSPVKKRFEKTK